MHGSLDDLRSTEAPAQRSRHDLRSTEASVQGSLGGRAVLVAVAVAVAVVVVVVVVVEVVVATQRPSRRDPCPLAVRTLRPDAK